MYDQDRPRRQHGDAHHDHGGQANGEHRVKDRSAACGWTHTRASTGQSTTASRTISARPAAARSSWPTPCAYLDPAVAAAKAEPVPEGTIYTCPMHPEIRQVGPGSCPICGMALEPVLATADAEPNPRADRHDAPVLDRRWCCRLPVFALEMGGHLTGLDHLISPADVELDPVAAGDARWCCGAAGRSSCAAGSRSSRRNLNMFTLIAMGTGVAWVYSVVATLAPGIFPAAFRGRDGAVAVYFEAAAVITVLVLLGQVLELRARESTSGAIRALLDLAPKTARRIRADGAEEEVQLDSVHVGDRLRVRPGEKVPVDGASSWKVAAPSTNRWSPASRCRSPRRSAPR